MDETWQFPEDEPSHTADDWVEMEGDLSQDEAPLETVQGEVVDEDETYLPDPGGETEILRPPAGKPSALIRPPTVPDSAPAHGDRVEEVMPQAVWQRGPSRLAIFPLALGLIGLGLLLLAEDRVEGVQITTNAAAVILVGALVLTYLFRFFASGRRERGLFFLAVVIMTWGALVALISLEGDTFSLEEYWPLTLAGVGVALFVTFLFERSHQVGLVFPGILLLFASGVSFAVSLNVISDSVLRVIADYWPLVIAFIGLTLLPSALQKRS